MSADGFLQARSGRASMNDDSTQVDFVVVILTIVGTFFGAALFYCCWSPSFQNKYCCWFPWFRRLDTGEGHEFDRGPIVRKAGLLGMRRKERTAILKAILKGKPYTVDMVRKRVDQEYVDVENPKTSSSMTKKNSHTLNMTNDSKMKKIVSEEKMEKKKQMDDDDDDVEKQATRNENTEESDPKDADGDPQPNEKEDEEDLLDESKLDTTCAICLNDYEEGELVVTGTNCNHMFHHSCLFDWLSKHDHCPYCREEIVKPREMKEMAVQVLGQERVDQLIQRSQNQSPEPMLQGTTVTLPPSNDDEDAQQGEESTQEEEEEDAGTNTSSTNSNEETTIEMMSTQGQQSSTDKETPNEATMLDENEPKEGEPENNVIHEVSGGENDSDKVFVKDHKRADSDQEIKDDTDSTKVGEG